jgi:hypothetical protein
MQSELQIVTQGIQLNEETKGIIQKKTDGLDELPPKITSCRLTLSGHESGHEGLFEVEDHIDLNVPNEELVADHCHEPGVKAAVNSVFRGAR